ncbi:hypothetical protein FRX31_009202, partial [Thalictrum thalictroides]
VQALVSTTIRSPWPSWSQPQSKPLPGLVMTIIRFPSYYPGLLLFIISHMVNLWQLACRCDDHKPLAIYGIIPDSIFMTGTGKEAHLK